MIAAAMVLGGIALRTAFQVEKSRQRTLFETTLALADERGERLDNAIIAQDNVVISLVNPAALASLPNQWLPTASRETPTIRAIVVLELSHPEHPIVAFVSRAPGPEDESFRKFFVHRLMNELNLAGDPSELRHLHHVGPEQEHFLLSYWRTVQGPKTYLTVAWHDTPRIVHELVPQLYRDVERGLSRMNVIDEDGRIVYGPPITVGEFTVGRPFPTTLYQWRVQVALQSAEELGQLADRKRQFQLVVVLIAIFIMLAGTGVLVTSSLQQRRISNLKSEFVANVSHELKTPLSLIRMFAELLLSGRVSSEEKQREYLRTVIGESDRLTALIDNVLDFARLERGQGSYTFAPNRLDAVVQRTVDACQARAEAAGKSLHLNVKKPIPLALLDGGALELAVMNLVDNALKYAKGSSRIEVDIGCADGRFELSVADDGPGIAPEEADRIFERFVRGTKSHGTRGSGIGLALVKHICEEHGGSVHVESRQPTGARFVIRLPVRAPG